MTFLLFIAVCLSPARPCLFFSSLWWTLLLKSSPLLQLTKARLEGEERGQPLTWECHILLGATINFATLCSSLKGLLGSCAVWFHVSSWEDQKKIKPLLSLLCLVSVLSLIRFLGLFATFCQTSYKMEAACAVQMIAFILPFPLCSYHLSQPLFNTNQLTESVVIAAAECL